MKPWKQFLASLSDEEIETICNALYQRLERELDEAVEVRHEMMDLDDWALYSKMSDWVLEDGN